MLKKFAILFCAALVAVACSDDVESNQEQDDNVRQQGEDNHGGNGITQDDAGNASTDEDAGWEDTGSNSETDASEPAPDVADCTPGESLQCDGDHSVVVCNDDGDGVETEACPDSAPNCFQGECGDQICEPGVPSCLDTATSQICNQDGTGYGPPIPCEGDAVCDNGTCSSICEFGPKQASSHFGCEYWTVYLDQYDEPDVLGSPGQAAADVPHAIVISNPNDEDATIHFETFAAGESVDVDDPVVPGGDSRSFTMPRLELGSTGIFRNAIFVRSSVPVTAHQFNPPNNDQVFSNDASLLLPISSLGTEYYVMNWPTQVLSFDGFPGMFNDFDFDDIEDQHSYVTIIASEPGETNVVVTSTAQITDGDDFSGFPPGVSRNFELSFGDVLNLQASTESLSADMSHNDLTGTHIVSDRNVAVFAGHEQAVIGYDSSRDSCCADHIEQQLLPVESWGNRYIAPFSPGRTETKDQWVIVAGEDGVTVNTDPPQSEANGVNLDAGEYVKFFTADDFEVEATGKISVGQFLTSQQQTAEVIGDPAFVLAVPIERFRDDYHVMIPSGYAADYITMMRPAGVEVILDGQPVADSVFEPVGSGEFETGYVAVDPGVHILESEEPFGVSAHGLDHAVSYGYPGGLNVVGAEDEQ